MPYKADIIKIGPPIDGAAPMCTTDVLALLPARLYATLIRKGEDLPPSQQW